ncbi:MAG: HAD hydrolase-like protein [Calditrichia bacterium]
MNKQDLLFLIDVDGTLISTNFKAPQLMLEAVKLITGRDTEFHREDFAGRLDPIIIGSLIRRAGIKENPSPEMFRSIVQEYLKLLESRLDENDIHIFDGVVDFLDYLKKYHIPYVLLTGNMRAGAEIKLKKAGLWHYFGDGAFADDGDSRDKLVPVAIDRARKLYQSDFSKRCIWVLGDSVHDITCAHHNHVNALIVKTGNTPVQILEQHHPEYLCDTLEDPKILIEDIMYITQNKKSEK